MRTIEDVMDCVDQMIATNESLLQEHLDYAKGDERKIGKLATHYRAAIEALREIREYANGD